jgi:hypothetical protein
VLEDVGEFVEQDASASGGGLAGAEDDVVADGVGQGVHGRGGAGGQVSGVDADVGEAVSEAFFQVGEQGWV